MFFWSVDIFNVWINWIFFCVLILIGLIVDLINVFLVGIVGGIFGDLNIMYELIKGFINGKCLFLIKVFSELFVF